MTDADLDDVVDAIRDFVVAGRTPEDARASVMRLVSDPELVDRAVDVYREQARDRGYVTLREPRAAYENVPEWYPGSPDNGQWHALKDHLRKQGLADEAIHSLDVASDKVVASLHPPGLDGFRTRGLVLGYVQSGKTSNYTAVITKAADIGYRLFIVLAGMTDALREQTQRRLDTDLVGVGKDGRWFQLTEAGSDFSASRTNAGLLAKTDLGTLAVVKKNTHILTNLADWLRTASRDVLDRCPTLIIDDEADQASMNVAASKDERSALNRRIIELASMVHRVGYVGYTATPFANVLTDPNVPEDLYPRHFIVDLPRPDNYFGTEALFGRDPLESDEDDTAGDGLDMIRLIPEDEESKVRPIPASTKDVFVPELVRSLRRSVLYFWLATAARRARDRDPLHSSMLLHTSQYVDVHERLGETVGKFVEQYARNIDLSELERLWKDESGSVPCQEFGLEEVLFRDLRPHLDNVIQQTRIVIENAGSRDRIDYGEPPSVQVVIGGQVLSRGLTLEGLIVSYFVRSSTRAYDTLLQMGRWFGFRRGYEDLPRIWMTQRLMSHFRDLALVEAEIRSDIARLADSGRTPLEIQVRVRTHQELDITARLKMRDAVDANVSYSGRRVQTIRFRRTDTEWLGGNIQASRDLASSARAAGCQFKKVASGRHWIARGVPCSAILRFLTDYQAVGTLPGETMARVVRPDLIRHYVENAEGRGELLTWNVVIVGRRRQSRTFELLPGLTVPLINRSRLDEPDQPVIANLKAILSESDRYIDLDSAAETRDPGEGLLLLYPIDRESIPKGARRENRVPMDAAENVMGMAMVFPESAYEDVKVRYKMAKPLEDDEKLDPILALTSEETDEL